MDKLREVVLEWIQKAENDFLAVEILMRAETCPLDVLCFHCQQTAEKYMKAILVERQKRVRKIHDLQALLDECLDLAPELESVSGDILDLQSYGPEVRYPGWPDISVDDLPRVMQMMERIRRQIRGYFESRGVL